MSHQELARREARHRIRILVVNVNTSAALTRALQLGASRAAAAGTDIIALTPSFGPESVESRFEAALSTVGVLDCVLRYDGPFDGVIVAGFGEPGREMLQEVLDVPVVDITDAATHIASLVAPKFSIITTLARAVPQIFERLDLNGLSTRCGSIRPIGVPVLELDIDPGPVVAAVVREARTAMEQDGAEAICLGCAGMVAMAEQVAAALPIPVVDGVTAAVGLVETLINLRLSPSKLSTYAPPDGNKRMHGWPLADPVVAVRSADPALLPESFADLK